ncbi:hypothetical protein GQ42DRAFT_41504 [Ramicandelaber brevisporus]|nr:hypothetical protein GQ42DRAFT_41504 [Ramicandelaber brevisporus]
MTFSNIQFSHLVPTRKGRPFGLAASEEERLVRLTCPYYDLADFIQSHQTDQQSQSQDGNIHVSSAGTLQTSTNSQQQTSSTTSTSSTPAASAGNMQSNSILPRHELDSGDRNGQQQQQQQQQHHHHHQHQLQQLQQLQHTQPYIRHGIDHTESRNIGLILQAMDKQYDSGFYGWIKSEANVEAVSQYMGRIANEFPVDRIINTMRWLITNWRVESISLVIKRIVFGWTDVELQIKSGYYPPDAIPSRKDDPIGFEAFSKQVIVDGDIRRAVFIRELTIGWEPHHIAQTLLHLSQLWPTRERFGFFIINLCEHWDFSRLSKFLQQLDNSLVIEHQTKLKLLQQTVRKDATQPRSFAIPVSRRPAVPSTQRFNLGANANATSTSTSTLASGSGSANQAAQTGGNGLNLRPNARDVRFPQIVTLFGGSVNSAAYLPINFARRPLPQRLQPQQHQQHHQQQQQQQLPSTRQQPRNSENQSSSTAAAVATATTLSSLSSSSSSLSSSSVSTNNISTTSTTSTTTAASNTASTSITASSPEESKASSDVADTSGSKRTFEERSADNPPSDDETEDTVKRSRSEAPSALCTPNTTVCTSASDNSASTSGIIEAAVISPRQTPSTPSQPSRLMRRNSALRPLDPRSITGLQVNGASSFVDHAITPGTSISAGFPPLNDVPFIATLSADPSQRNNRSPSVDAGSASTSVGINTVSSSAASVATSCGGSLIQSSTASMTSDIAASTTSTGNSSTTTTTTTSSSIATSNSNSNNTAVVSSNDELLTIAPHRALSFHEL